ncbi:hypothetical protein T05_14434 [Trichinella murrelli]|uniref:Uncharacterized protein n=1 Tax=Trichinella murrelli TaxID=144512 RepID=A0A0V0T3A2_9BILA|nr:hypothetical protein T05_14434 [Trichinella murrelli]
MLRLALWRRVLTMSMFLLWRYLPDRYRLKFIFTKKFQCTKTGFQRCAMQITIAIKVPYRQ